MRVTETTQYFDENAILITMSLRVSERFMETAQNCEVGNIYLKIYRTTRPAKQERLYLSHVSKLQIRRKPTRVQHSLILLMFAYPISPQPITCITHR